MFEMEKESGLGMLLSVALTKLGVGSSDRKPA